MQKVPAILDEVHRLIEKRRLRFALTGSSARKLQGRGVNLLAGRASTLALHPLTRFELGESFVLRRSLVCNVERKVVEDYFGILEDLLLAVLAVRVPVFSKRTRRAVSAHPKFYLFDTGVYRTLRPRGPLDTVEEIDGAAVETLVFQEIRALNDYLDLRYGLHHWRTPDGLEVDIVLYGERGIRAIEVKRGSRVRAEDRRGLEAFLGDYPMADAWLVYGGTRRYQEGRIHVIPIDDFLRDLSNLL